MMELWYGLSAGLQDALLAAGALAVPALIALAVLPGHRPWPLVRALVRRHWGVSAVFVALIAGSVALGTGLLAQERAIRAATARAADPFDLIIAAPGSELTVLFASVFLQPSDMALVGGDVLDELSSDERVAFAAPIAFGDSVGDAPIVGTTAALVERLGGVAEGRIWVQTMEAVVGSAVAARLGDHLEPAHGHGDAADAEAHGEVELTVVGRMAATGTPWDRAVVVPVEAVWQVHGLADGHREAGRLGPPFDPELVPGMPAVVVTAEGLGAAYSLRTAYTRDGATMAFFPGAVLAQLHRVMGDVRAAMSVMAVVSQVLVAGGVLCGLAIVARLFRRQLALLAALGAPERFVVAVMWLYSVAHLVAGAVLGLALGQVATAALSEVVSRRTGLDLTAQPGAGELVVVAGFLGLASLVALLPALAAPARRPAAELR